ncbi:MAG: AMP-binding protein [Candidatus Binatia bacterium]
MENMSDRVGLVEQATIRANCFHPTGGFIDFSQEEAEQSIPRRFEKMVRKYPERIAVKTKPRRFTYAELNRAANRVAHAILAQRGVVQEPIALLFPKGAPLAAAILGVLKAGKIFVLLDPALPHARLSYILRDAQPSLIVTNHEYLVMAKALSEQTSWLNIDTLKTSLSAENPGMALAPDALAYILYTSGSTGRPKGIVENHRNVMHYIMTETNDLHICAEDRLTFFASQGRDIFRAVLNGAAVYPIDIKQEGSAGLARWLIEEEITIYNSVTSAFRHFVSTLAGTEQFPQLRLIKLMGETVYRRDVELYQKHFSERCIFVNWYGPNETGLLSYYLVDKATKIKSSVVPVGYAVRDKLIRVLGEDGQEVGCEQVGEITVQSRYVSPGYWRRDDLTRTAFPLSASGDVECCYRTGDLGTVQPDGCLTHLGRKDFQVKIRGNRVEIAEVEMALMNLDAVREAAIVAREDVPGHKRLVAYIVPASAPAPIPSTLRVALAAKLPDYMIPSTFVLLDSLPLMGIGKVDRGALPAPNGSRPELEQAFVAPRGGVEETVAEIWRSILGLEKIGINDNFFDLGGHSLLAMQVLSRLHEVFDIEPPLHVLFENPTVAELAAAITLVHATKTAGPNVTEILADIESISDEEAQALTAKDTL